MYTVEIIYVWENYEYFSSLKGVYSTLEGAQNKASVLKDQYAQDEDKDEDWDRLVIQLWDGDQSQIVQEIPL